MGDETVKTRVRFEGESDDATRAAAEVDEAFEKLVAQAERFNDRVERGAELSAKLVAAFARADASNEARALKAEVTSMGHGFTGAAQKVGMLGQSLGKIAGPAGMALAGITALAYAGTELAHMSEEVTRAGDALQVSIDGATQVLGHHVDEVTLAKEANRAFSMDIISSGEELTALARAAEESALRTGHATQEQLSAVIDALKDGSEPALKQIGVTLDQAEAEQIYADSLGIAVESLTAYQRSNALSKAAVLELGGASRRTGKDVESLAGSWLDATARLERFKNGVLGFNGSIGNVRDNLRKLDSDTLALFGSRATEDVNRLRNALREVGLSYDDLISVANELGDVEEMRGGQLDRENRIKQQRELVALAEEALDWQTKIAQKEAEAQAAADLEEYVAFYNFEADALEHEAALLGVVGGHDREILDLQIRALEARWEAASALSDTVDNAAELLNIERQIELVTAQRDAPKRGGGRGTTSAEVARQQADAILEAKENEIRLLEVQSRLQNTVEEDRRAIAEKRRALAWATLDAERQVLEMTRQATQVERDRAAARLAQIDLEQQIVQLTTIADAREEAARLVAEQGEIALAALSAEANEANRVDEMKLAHLDDQVAALDGIAGKEATLHAVRMAQIKAEAEAEDAALARKGQIIAAQSGLSDAEKIKQADDLRQVAHDREMARMEADLDLRRLVASESERIAQEQAAALQNQLATIESTISTIESVSGGLQSKIGEWRSAQQAEDSAALDEWVRTQEARASAASDSYDRQIAAAKGNVTRTSQLEKAKAAQQRSIQASIEKAQKNHAEQVERQERRSKGISLLLEGALALGRAVSSYPNIPQMVTLAAASALDFAWGGMVLAGGMPGAGGVSIGSIGASSSGASSSVNYVEAPSTPGSTGSSAIDKQPRKKLAASDSGGGGYVVHGDVHYHALGSIDRDAAETWAFENRRAARSREMATAS